MTLAAASPAFTRQGLEAEGFRGWSPLLQVGDSGCPSSGGVYVVLRAGESAHKFLPVSCGGWFKGRDPSVAPDVLAMNWVEGAQTLYIGKADNLRRRLRQYAAFGRGKAVGHWGGRLIWHLHDAPDLLVAWRETPEQSPLIVESELIEAFRAAHGKPPFANMPHLLWR